jgi:glucose/mannose-6-phosphate isomerase
MTVQHEALKKFSSQITFALDHYHPHGLSADAFSNVVIAGMGGSGIGGKIAKSLFSRECPVPVETVADYSLPAYASDHSLVILASYSGDTEETLQLFEEVKTKGCKVLVLTSGGKLQKLAADNQLPLYEIQPGFQPRMALGFSLTYLVLIFAELLGKEVTGELRDIAERVSDAHPYQEDAKQMFNSVKSKLKQKLVILTDALFEPIGIRFCQQIQENAKHECFHHVVPEMNHNVIESYYGQMETVFFFLHSQSNERVTSRFDFLTSLLEVEYNKVVNIVLDEFSLTTVYETIYCLDWLSLYIADFRQVDSLNVPNIKSLKEFLEQA